MATKIFVPRSYELTERRSFEINTTGGILMGKLVELDSTGKVVVTSTEAKAIGQIDDMPEYRALNSTGTVAKGDMATVVLFGKTFKAISGGTFSAGAYVKPSSGALITSGTVATKMIAVNASTAAAQYIEYLVR